MNADPVDMPTPSTTGEPPPVPFPGEPDLPGWSPLGWLRSRVYNRPATPRRWTLLLYGACWMTTASWLGPRRWPL